MPSSLPLSIGIVGGGIGGLTVANALARRGASVRVYEKASHYIPTAGAGFGFSPNGQVCLKSLDIETHQHLHRFDWLVHLDKEGKQDIESDFFTKVMKRHGFTLGGCLRADLIETLSQELNKHDSGALRYSHKVVTIEQDDSKVRLLFDKDKSEAEHDLLVGADGIHSTVAELLDIDPSPPVYSGANIFYGVIEDPDHIDFENDTVAQDHAVVQGNVTGEFITFRAGPEARKVQIWANTYLSTSPPPREEWSATDLASEDLTSLLNRFSPKHPIHELAAHTTPGRLLHFGLFYRRHKDIWSKGRTALLGDACHATLPYVGQGANQAIEDAIVLADCLDTNGNHRDAFQDYYKQRSRRTRRVVRMANWMDKLHHTQNPLVAMLRNYLFASFAKGDRMAQMIEHEIVNECPIKDYDKYR